MASHGIHEKSGLARAEEIVRRRSVIRPEALELGRDLPSGGKPELAGGIVFGVLLMAPLALI